MISETPSPTVKVVQAVPGINPIAGSIQSTLSYTLSRHRVGVSMNPKLFPEESSHSAALFRGEVCLMAWAQPIQLTPVLQHVKVALWTYGYMAVSGLMLGSEIKGLSAFLFFFVEMKQSVLVTDGKGTLALFGLGFIRASLAFQNSL